MVLINSLNRLSLQRVFQLNATSCILFGLLFICLPSQTAEFLSPQQPAPALVIIILGAVLVANGLHLLWASFLTNPPQSLVQYFSTGDFLWVIGTIVLLILKFWITSPLGISAALLVAVMVATMGVLQWLKQAG